MHLVSPIFKSGNKSHVENYRPISLLCVILKVLERLIYKHLLDFASKSLSSFEKNHSTLQQMLVFGNIYGSINDKLMWCILTLRRHLIQSLIMNSYLNFGRLVLPENCGIGSKHISLNNFNAFPSTVVCRVHCLFCQGYLKVVYWVLFCFDLCQ